MEILERENLVHNAALVGKYLKERLEQMQTKSQIIGNVSGPDMMIGIEIVIDKASKAPSPLHSSAISGYCQHYGLLLGHRPSGAFSGNVIRLLPPLNLTHEEADEALALLERAVEHAEATVNAKPGNTTAWT